ncbi:MAG: hypothetical protein ACR2IV_11335 [Bryobacteraceae bacterium]
MLKNRFDQTITSAPQHIAPGEAKGVERHNRAERDEEEDVESEETAVAGEVEEKRESESDKEGVPDDTEGLRDLTNWRRPL